MVMNGLTPFGVMLVVLDLYERIRSDRPDERSNFVMVQLFNKLGCPDSYRDPWTIGKLMETATLKGLNTS
ncbi:hypothetical protein LV84_00171 [Algoriphagus ratkowskyi]|uniref:Uncharacterized protein n=1 Tax=Algoriphagus ratkowskyi TaxID=57028 RepID=A0A2W7RK26_9BACT|nr:hypothetical protein LV84_00171 [Algoriphagus ratkowskyi]